MALLDRAVGEVRQRAALLPREVGVWKTGAAANVAGQGIHGSQAEALALQMDELLKRQDDLLRQLKPTLPLRQFAEIHAGVLFEIAATNGLWNVFRNAIAQRQDPALRRLLDAADLVASDCYLSCMRHARDWGLVSEAEFREPPLVYLEPEGSPATAARGEPFEALGAPVSRYRRLRLPIPVVMLPFDHAACVWLLCGLHHEVGHDIDLDLGLRAELRTCLDKRLKADGAPTERRKTWRRWAGEVLADGFGVLLGGAGFAHTLAALLLIQAPLVPEPDGRDLHPHPWLRVALIEALLRGTDITALGQQADRIEALRADVPRPLWAGEYATETGTVAEVVLHYPLDALGRHPLADFAVDLANDAARTRQLATFLDIGFNRPDPALPTPFPWRLVPAAGQLAFAELAAPDWSNPDAWRTHQARLNELHERTLTYLEAIARPNWLAGGAAANRLEFLRRLARDVKFEASVEQEQLT